MEVSLSKQHRRVLKRLDELQISYIAEYPLGQYSLDIYLPEWHAAIEVDGPFHSPRRDALRDQRLFERFGVKTYRIDTRKPGWYRRLEFFMREVIEDAARDADERRQRMWSGGD